MTAISMSNKLRQFLLAIAFLAGSMAICRAEDTRQPPPDATSRHTARIAGAEIAYTATAGSLALNDSKGERHAWMSYVAYVRDGGATEARPVTVVFNGGPGAASAYLHLGALGPRVVEFGADGGIPNAPARLIDNPDCWLDLSDLVFIDPVGTGLSRTVAASGEANQRYWGVREDLQAFAAFIDLYFARNNRQASPKYLVGESYGGFRAPRLPQFLSREHGIGIAGMMLVSPVLEFSLLMGDTFEPLPDAFRLPSYAAVSLGSRALGDPTALPAIERFALGPYLAALVATPRNEATLRPVYAEVARLIGLPEALVAEHNGRVPPGVFGKEKRRAERPVVSRYDGAVAGPDPYPESSGSAASDPIMGGLRPFLTGAMVGHLATLGLRSELNYQLTNGDALGRWNWRSTQGSREGQVGAANKLREMLADNAALRVAIAHGVTDLVTPYLTSRYVIDRLPPSLTRNRVSQSLMEGGHMMYTRPASRARLHAEAARLYSAPL